ncbi:DUF4124 domain-containing protein [Glaciecola sp. KUL10]|uniref:DUF4124 domain-containing protein n=1 Tax=Glaciecola sp. (strain KUL10) TaxID=2161813 RepID=UPI0013145831|nr:DUF4124 domain-containing protein [Glaciecola sp. KUL10]
MAQKKSTCFGLRNLKNLVILVALASTNIVQAQEIYKKINADGSVTFSDKPFDGAQQVDLSNGASTIIPAQASPINTPKHAPTVTQKIPVLTIESPKHQATIRSNTGKVHIVANMEPKISGRFLLRLRDRTLESTSGTFSLDGLDRGTYPYQINFVDNKGKVIASSPTQRFYLHKNSIIKKPLVQTNP